MTDTDPDSTTNINRSGGADLNAQGNITIGGDVVGRDKITYEAPAGGVASLHQLLPPPPDFTGREAELTELLAKFDQGVAISGLQGQGGIGKTALALKLAAQLIDRYPDAQIFLDLKGVSDLPLPASELAAHVVRSFQPTAKLPDTEAELMAAYRTVLFNKQVLLLLDNARDAEQIKPLLPAPVGCGVIVTSRLHFHVPGLFVQNLDALLVRDACALLLKIAARIGDEAEHIAQLCGYLPLTLTMAGSALAERIDLSVASYARRLEDERTRLDMVAASFTLSYGLLSEDLRAMWRMLAVFPNTFEVEGAAAVCDVERDVAEMRLSELVRYSLMEWEATTGRYRLHDMARLFVNSTLSDEGRTAAQWRHAVYYKDVLAAADDLYRNGGDDLARGLVSFDREWLNIQAGQAYAAELAPTADAAAQLCNDYAGAGDSFLRLRLHPRNRIRWLEAALSAARQLSDRRSESRHLDSLGLVYADLGEARRAIEFYEQALTIAREMGDRIGEIRVLSDLGLAYADLDAPRRAIELYEQALTIAREIDDRRGGAVVLGNLGNANADLGDLRRAIEFYEQALEIARAIGDQHNEEAWLGNLGLAYAELGEPRRAIDYYEQALTIDRTIGDQRGEGTDLGNLGLAYSDLGDLRRAIEFYEQALEIARAIDDRRSEGRHLGNLGLAYSDLGEPRRAIECYEKALEIARAMGDQRNEGIWMGNLGNNYAALGEREMAISYTEASLNILETIESPKVEIFRRNLATFRTVSSKEQGKKKWQFWK